MRLDHIGIAVYNLADATAVFARLLDLPAEDFHYREVPHERVRVAEFGLGETSIELMEPAGEDSPISRFLAKRGPGVHHLCYLTADIEEAFRRLRENGVQALSEAVREGVRYRYFFVHPQSAAGVLTEFRQPVGELP